MSPIEQFAEQKMAEWGLTEKGWAFTWNNSRRAIGSCKFQRLRHDSIFIHSRPVKLVKEIRLSRFMLGVISEDEQRDTVLHEIAHALDFEQRGTSAHDDTWKWWAVKVGAKPEPCKRMDANERAAIIKRSKYTLRCPNGHERAAHRVRKHPTSCGECCPNRFNEAYVFQVIQNY